MIGIPHRNASYECGVWVCRLPPYVGNASRYRRASLFLMAKAPYRIKHVPPTWLEIPSYEIQAPIFFQEIFYLG